MVKTNLDSIECSGFVTDKQGVTYSADGKYLLKGNDNLREYTVREGVEVICDEAFFDGFVKHITLPKSLKVIGCEAFAHSDLMELVIPDGLEDIRSGAFYGCKALKRVVLPMSAKRIDEDAFPVWTEIQM